MSKRKIKVVHAKSWDRDILKQKIRDFLDKRGSADEMDIAIKFSLRLQFACEVIDELVKEGKIAPVIPPRVAKTFRKKND